jgi:hypothetical protein
MGNVNSQICVKRQRNTTRIKNHMDFSAWFFNPRGNLLGYACKIPAYHVQNRTVQLCVARKKITSQQVFFYPPFFCLLNFCG